MNARGRFAPYIVGVALLALALVLLLFTFYALVAGESATAFLVAALASAAFGGPLAYLGKRDAEPTRREALIGVLLLWLLVPLFGAIPFWLGAGFSPLDAAFESMSGFTTTGATVLRDFESFPSTLFMWRSLIQWFGGVGIIVLFIAVFPQLAIAGRQLFFAEAPGPTEDRLTPRLRNTSNAVLLVYVGLTLACTLSYLIGGMDLYNALSHAFTTLAAGGFSPNGLSFQGFDNPALDWIATVFMVFAGANFALQYRAFTGRPRDLLRDAEFRAYLGVIAVAGVALSLLLFDTYTVGNAFRHGFFQVLSILTTTGYASVDFALWEQDAQIVLLLLMFVGGSAGSAGGGIKVVRWLMIVQQTRREVKQALHPRAILPVRVGGRTVPEEVLRAVAGFITLYIGLFAASTALLVGFGADFVTGFTAAIACLGNIGPGLASVGPMLNFADLHPVSRGVLIFDMYAGRLEVVTVFVILTTRWWHLPRQGLWRFRRRA